MSFKAAIFRIFVRGFLYSWYYVERVIKPNRRFSFLSDKAMGEHQNVNNMTKNLLFKYHVKQFHESSCSVASVACVVNALLEIQGKKPATPVTQHQLLDRVRTAHWKERMSDGGYKGKRGLPIDVLGDVVKQSLKVYNITHSTVEIVWADLNEKGAQRLKNALRDRLKQFESDGSCVLIAHFDQGSFLPEFHIPHISPVGGYDEQADTVTMLDVDPAVALPYQIPFETFFKGISFDYYQIFKPYGYICGGYILVRLQA